MTLFGNALQRDEQQLQETSQLLAALAHPVRLRIVEGLLTGKCCVGSMVECLALPQPLVSRHLAILRNAGIVSSSVEGRQRNYEVVDPTVRRLVRVLFTQASSPPTQTPPATERTHRTTS